MAGAARHRVLLFMAALPLISPSVASAWLRVCAFLQLVLHSKALLASVTLCGGGLLAPCVPQSGIVCLDGFGEEGDTV